MADDARPVLIAYDGSDSAKNAIARAGEELRPGRRAIVLTTWGPPVLFMTGPSGVPDIEDALEQEAERRAAEGAELARAAGFDAVGQAVRSVPVWQGIVDVAEAEGASLIVMGSRGLTGVKYALLGSVATAVSQHTQGSVLIVH